MSISMTKAHLIDHFNLIESKELPEHPVQILISPGSLLSIFIALQTILFPITREKTSQDYVGIVRNSWNCSAEERNGK